MSTEQKLREALSDLFELVESNAPDCHYSEHSAITRARAALALPPTPVKRQWRVNKFGWRTRRIKPEWLCDSDRLKFANLLQHRDVPEPGPWEIGK